MTWWVSHSTWLFCLLLGMQIYLQAHHHSFIHSLCLYRGPSVWQLLFWVLAIQNGAEEMNSWVSQSSHSSEGFQCGSWKQVFFCFGRSWDLWNMTQTSCLLLTKFNQRSSKQNLMQQFWNAGLQVGVGLSLQQSSEMPFKNVETRPCGFFWITHRARFKRSKVGPENVYLKISQIILLYNKLWLHA